MKTGRDGRDERKSVKRKNATQLKKENISIHEYRIKKLIVIMEGM